MDSDRTPADVIAEAAVGQTWDEDSPAAILDALAAAGYRVTPIPDDNTRADVTRLCSALRSIGIEGSGVHVAADYLAAAYLDGQPQDRPAQ